LSATEAASERGGNNPVEEGSSSTAHGDRPAQDPRGEDEKGKTGFEANTPQTPEIEAGIYRRRRAKLQAFMIVGRAMLFNVARAFNLPTQSKAAMKGRGKASTGGRAAQLRKKRNRSAKRQSTVRRFADGARRSALLCAITRAAAAFAARQARVAEYRTHARLDPFRNWGGAPLRACAYRRSVGTARRALFFGRTRGHFVNPVVSGYTNSNSPSNNSCNIFNSNGGNVAYIAPPPQYLDTSNPTSSLNYGNWLFTGAFEMQDGDGVGDLMMILPYVPLATCNKINSLIGYPVGISTSIPWINSVHTMSSQKFTGSTVDMGAIGDNSTQAEATPASGYLQSGCVLFDNWDYHTTPITATGIFYKVLFQD
jgi:hypothetical protein